MITKEIVLDTRVIQQGKYFLNKAKYIFSRNLNSALFGYSKNMINLVKIFVFRLLEMAANQNAPGLNRCLSSK